MAKEAELKKIELKVSVNCCDGCKRKVKKVLQSVEGVLKTEIDPLHPKVTVLGNVDPQILIKRLLKTGKQAELWSSGNQNAGKEKKEADIPVAKEKDKSKSECEKAKSSDSCVKVPSFTAPPVNSTVYGQEYLLYERPVFQPPYQTPTARVGDYFSDENTVGCHVM